MENNNYCQTLISMRSIDKVIDDLNASEQTFYSHRDFIKEVARQYGEELKAYVIYMAENNGDPHTVTIF